MDKNKQHIMSHGQQQQQGANQATGVMCPVSSRPIRGTSWSEVRTNTGHVYYYCQNTGISRWDVPNEVYEANKVDSQRPGKKRSMPRVIDEKMLLAMKRAKANGAVLAPEYEEMLSARKGSSEKGPTMSTKRKHATVFEKRQDTGKEEEFDVTFDEDDIEQDKTERVKEVTRSDVGPIAREAGGSEDDQKRDFFELLKEIGIHGFSRFEREVSKMQHDSRYLAVQDIFKRKVYFEEYCKGQATSMSQAPQKKHNTTVSRTDQLKHHVDAFNALLQEKVLKSSLAWRDIVHVLEKDDRFGGVSSEKQRVELFRNHQRKLEKAEYAKKISSRRMLRDIQAGKERQLDSSRRDALINYKALLAEMVRDPLATWESESKNLKSDPQQRASTELIDDKISKELFDNHIKDLRGIHQKKLFDIFAKNKLPASLTFEEVSGYLADDIDFLESPESLQMDAWKHYTCHTSVD